MIISLHVSVFLYSCLVSRTVGNEADSALESDELYSTVGGRLARRLCPRQDVTMRLFFNKRAIITIMRNLHLSTGATECKRLRCRSKRACDADRCQLQRARDFRTYAADTFSPQKRDARRGCVRIPDHTGSEHILIKTKHWLGSGNVRQKKAA